MLILLLYRAATCTNIIRKNEKLKLYLEEADFMKMAMPSMAGEDAIRQDHFI